MWFFDEEKEGIGYSDAFAPIWGSTIWSPLARVTVVFLWDVFIFAECHVWLKGCFRLVDSVKVARK